MKSADEGNRFRGHREEGRYIARESIFHVVKKKNKKIKREHIAAAEISRWNGRSRSIERPRTSALFNRTPVKCLNEILLPLFAAARTRDFPASAVPRIYLLAVRVPSLLLFFFFKSLLSFSGRSSLFVSSLRFTSGGSRCCSDRLY